MNTIISFVKRHPVATMIALVCVAWLLIFPLASVDAMLPVFLLTFVPAPAALLVAALSEGRAGAKDLVRRVTMWRVGLAWYAIALGLPMLVGLLAVDVAALLGAPGATQIGAFTPIHLMMPAFALGEELGWRGYLLPRFLARHSTLRATLILAAIWMGFHLPLYTPGHIWHGLPPSQALVILPYAILLSWAFVHTRGSVLIASLFHGGMNIASTIFYRGMEPAMASWMMAILFSIVALIVVIVAGPNLSRRGVSSGSEAIHESARMHAN